jgi:hypothetical protein
MACGKLIWVGQVACPLGGGLKSSESGAARGPRGVLCLRNACLRLKMTQSALRKELVSPIPKQPGADRVDLLVPIKLLQVTRKAVCGIVKDRVRAAVSGGKILDYWQHGGRSWGGSTYSAVTSVARALEDAITRWLDLHLISVATRKVYDTINRTARLYLTMRRIGIPEDVCECFMDIGRRNSQLVKSFWEPMGENGHGREFEAKRGFAQGATESPLLWIIFYDMVLCTIMKGGGGAVVRLATNGLQFDYGAGLAAFMDDLMVSTRSMAGLLDLIKVLDRVLTTVGLAIWDYNG